MSPGKEDQKEFVHHVGVGHVKVMLQCGDVDIAIKLGLKACQHCIEMPNQGF